MLMIRIIFAVLAVFFSLSTTNAAVIRIDVTNSKNQIIQNDPSWALSSPFIVNDFSNYTLFFNNSNNDRYLTTSELVAVMLWNNSIYPDGRYAGMWSSFSVANSNRSGPNEQGEWVDGPRHDAEFAFDAARFKSTAGVSGEFWAGIGDAGIIIRLFRDGTVSVQHGMFGGPNYGSQSLNGRYVVTNFGAPDAAVAPIPLPAGVGLYGGGLVLAAAAHRLLRRRRT
jgi:hypothetical protein